MNILVVGNGFDIAHNLPTSYKAFLYFTDVFIEFSKSQKTGRYPTAKSKDDTRVFDYLTQLYQNTDSKETTLIKELVSLTSDNIWLEHFKRIQIKDGWVDFEREISQVIQALDEVRHAVRKEVQTSGKFTKLTPYQSEKLQLLFGDGTLVSGLEPIIVQKEKLLDDLNRLTRCLEIYLCSFVERLTVSQKIPCISNLDIDGVISFNYTHTFEIVYDDATQKKVYYDFVHGEAVENSDVDHCNMIIGIDEYLSGEDRDRDNEFVYFKKFFQRIYKETGSSYREWLSQSIPCPAQKFNPKPSKIYIYGHSLDATDKDILRALLLSENTEVTIFYHNKKALANQIENLIKVIGEDELVHRTGGVHQTIRFVDIETANKWSKADLIDPIEALL